nr:esterase-like activity of phytase family protein [Chthonobacter rhizosphaerae]
MAVASTAVALSVGGTVLALSAGAATLPPTVTLATHPIRSFLIGDPETTRFGALEWLGGLEVEGSVRAVGGLSGIVMTEGGDAFLTITDDGLALQARIRRDDAGRPVALEDGRLKPLLDRQGRPFRGKIDADTESIDVRGHDAVVSVEGRRPKILAGTVEADGFLGPLKEIRLPPTLGGLRGSKGLETVVFGRPGGPFDGAIVTIAEEPARGATSDDNPGWIIGGPAPGAFLVANNSLFSVTDAKFGPGDDLFILERSFSLGDGVRCRIRRIKAADLKPGARVDGEVVLEADLRHQIDNMEAIAVWTDRAGRTRLSLLSDDNRSFLQRTVYLEFVLAAP